MRADTLNHQPAASIICRPRTGPESNQRPRMSDSAAGTAPMQSSSSLDRSRFGTLALVWGVGGFLAVLLLAVWRLVPLALASTEFAWHAGHWALFAANMVIMGWFEATRAFSRAIRPASPRGHATSSITRRPARRCSRRPCAWAS